LKSRLEEQATALKAQMEDQIATIRSPIEKEKADLLHEAKATEEALRAKLAEHDVLKELLSAKLAEGFVPADANISGLVDSINSVSSQLSPDQLMSQFEQQKNELETKKNELLTQQNEIISEFKSHAEATLKAKLEEQATALKEQMDAERNMMLSEAQVREDLLRSQFLELQKTLNTIKAEAQRKEAQDNRRRLLYQEG